TIPPSFHGRPLVLAPTGADEPAFIESELVCWRAVSRPKPGLPQPLWVRLDATRPSGSRHKQMTQFVRYTGGAQAPEMVQVGGGQPERAQHRASPHAPEHTL